MTWMGVPWLASLGIAIFCWIFITLWGAGVVISWGILFSLISQRIAHKNIYSSLIKVLLGAALWCGLETLWTYTPLWWPRDRLYPKSTQFNYFTTRKTIWSQYSCSSYSDR